MRNSSKSKKTLYGGRINCYNTTIGMPAGVPADQLSAKSEDENIATSVVAIEKSLIENIWSKAVK